MKLLDVNVVLAAYRGDHPDHQVARAWLDGLVARREQFGVPWMVWWSFLRLSGHRRLFDVPSPIAEGLAFIAAVRAQPGHLDVEPGARHWECLGEACQEAEAAADLIPDAVLVSLAIEHGASVVSFDRDFSRFSAVEWVRPG